MKISVSSYSFQQYVAAGKLAHRDIIRRAHEMGFEAVEFIDLPASSYEEQVGYARFLRSEADKYGMTINAYTIGANLYQGSPEADEKEVARVMRQIDVAKELGASLVRHDVCGKEKVEEKTVSFGKMLPTLATNARKIAAYAEELGIRTCSENHGFVAQDSDRVEALYNAVDHDNYGLLVDMGNFACADEDSARAVSRLAPYAIHAHAKDFYIRPFGSPEIEGEKSFLSRGCRRLVGCAVGDGDIPVAQCVAILKKAGYDGWLSIEFEGNGDCVEEIAKGLANLKSYLA